MPTDRRSRRRKSSAAAAPSSPSDDAVDVRVPPTPSRRARSAGGAGSESRKAAAVAAAAAAAGGSAEEEEEEVMDHGNASYAMLEQNLLGPGKRQREVTKEAVRSGEPYAFFDALVEELVQDPRCDEFLKPVLELYDDKEVPGYMEQIKRPMDLGTIKKRLKGGEYIKETRGVFEFDQEECGNDIRLVFENCMDYNDPKSDIHEMARKLLKKATTMISRLESKLEREEESAQKKLKREQERRRTKKAEEEVARAAEQARKASAAMEKLKREAEEAERKRLQEIKKKEAEWKTRMQQEKEKAVAAAVQEALAKKERDGRVMNTSSVSSDEHDGRGEVTFVFVSTVGMEKKRGRKSGLVMELERGHDELMKRRKVMIEACVELERLKQVEMTYEEKKAVCDEVAELDFVRMKAVADILARGMNRPDILNEVEVDVDVDHVDNVVLREIQLLLNNPAASTAKDALRQVESDMADIESKLLDQRYKEIGG